MVALRGVALSGVAVSGESFADKVLMECGMRNRRSAGGDLGDFVLQGERGGSETDGDFKDGTEENAGLVALDGWEIGDGPPLSNVNFGKFPPAVTGLLKTGVRALRKSVYADGVGIELSLLSSRLISLGLRALGSS